MGGLAGIALAKAGHEATAFFFATWKENMHLTPGRPLRLTDEWRALPVFP